MEQPDPITYPTVRIDGQDVEVKFRCGDLIRMKKSGLDLNEAKAAIEEQMEKALTVLSFGIAHTGLKITPEELADKIDLSAFGNVSVAINQAISKAMAQVTATVKAANLQTEQPPTATVQ